MASFCKDCDPDLADLDGTTTPEDWAEGRAAVVLCEGCGPIQVDPDGHCMSLDCLLGEGSAYRHLKLARQHHEKARMYKARGHPFWKD